MAILNWRLGSSSYGNRFGTTTSGSSPSSNYLSALNRDRSSSRDRSGYGSDYKSGYGSGSDFGTSKWRPSYSTLNKGSLPYSSSRYSGDSARGISAIASKFGETKLAPKSRDSGVTSPAPSYTSTRDSIKSPTFNYSSSSPNASKPPTSRSRESIKSPVSNYSTSSTISANKPTTTYSSLRKRDSQKELPQIPDTTTSSYLSKNKDSYNPSRTRESNYSSYKGKEPETNTTSYRSRDSGLNSPRVTNNEFSYSRPKESANEISYRTKTDVPITRTRTRELPQTPTIQESRPSKFGSSTYSSRYGTGSSYDKSGYNSDAKSGYGSDYSMSGYGSGYGSGTDTYKRYSWSRSNSYIKTPETPTTPTSYRPYSRQNSLAGSDTGGGGVSQSWRSRVHVDDTPTSKPYSPVPSTPSQQEIKETKSPEITEKKLQRPSAFQTAIGKLSQESKENASKEDKKPDLLSPNAVKVLPSFDINDVKLKNKAPADFTSGSDDSEEDDKNKNELKDESTVPVDKKVENANSSKILPKSSIQQSDSSSKILSKSSTQRQDSTSKIASKSSTQQSDSSSEIVPKTSVQKSDSSSKILSKSSTQLSDSSTAPSSSRPLKHLCAAPSLPPRRDILPSQGMVSPPTFKKSSKFATPFHELATSSSKWLEEKTQKRSPSPNVVSENSLKSNSEVQKLSPLPPKSPVLDRKKETKTVENESTETKQNGIDIGNKDYRKSVLNMDIHPDEEEIIRRQQEEKREELRRLKKQALDESLKQSGKDELLESETDKSLLNKDIEKNKSSENLLVEENKNSQPVKISIEKSPSKSKGVERKHSKGKGDSLRKSGSFRRQRERRAAHSSRTSSSSSSSDSESEAKSNRSRTSSFSKLKRRGSRDGNLSKTSSKEMLLDGRRTRNNSETVCKTNSKGIIKSRNNSKNNSKNSLIDDNKLSVPLDFESTEKDNYLLTKRVSPSKELLERKESKENIVNGDIGHERKIYSKQKKSSNSSSSSSSSSSESDSSESAGEEGYLFSISKSRSVKKSKSGLNKLSNSPQTNSNYSEKLTKKETEEQNGPADIECTFNVVIPRRAKIKPSVSNKSANSELNKKEQIQETKQSNLRRSPSVGNNTDCDISEMPDFDAPETVSKSSSKNNVSKVNENGYEPFAWPEGSPTATRKKVILPTEEKNDEEISIADFTEGYNEFVWPDGSPVASKKTNYVKTQWDTDTETEMNQTEWSDASPPISKMPQLDEETEDEIQFEWPSSPEASRRYPLTAGLADETQAESESFEWPSSPEYPEMKDPKFISFTKDIDCLLSNDKATDSFAEMEKKLGYEEPDEEEDKTDAKLKEENVVEENEKQNENNEKKAREEKKKRKLSLRERAKKNLSLFIDKLSNIDEILGSVLQPLSGMTDETDEPIQEIDASEVKVHDAQANRAEIDENIEEIDASAVVIRKMKKRKALKAEIIKAVKEGLDDATLQVYRDGDYGNYLDLESSLAEQADDIDGLTDSKKNAIILRTQLSVRVHAIIEKLLKSEGRELRRALFSLKQIFQDDKDLVHAFVQNEGLKCLVKVGSSADHNYQTYILRALGQVMLYVDGMTGISNSPQTVQWLYSLVSSKFRLVVKTSLKLLLVFVEYSEYNATILVKAIKAVDRKRGDKPWTIIMRLLEGKDCPDTELQIYAMTLINKTLNGLPDQDSYYDQTDYLEEQDMELLIQKFIHNPNSDLDLLQQLTIYEAVLAYEDGDDVCRTRTIDPTIRQDLRFTNVGREDSNRRKSKRHFVSPDVSERKHLDDGITSSDDEHRGHVTVINIKGGLPADDLGGVKHSEMGVTPALRRRRERAERHKTFLNEQEMLSESRRGSQSPDEMGSVEDENRKNNEISWLLELMQAKKEGEVKDIAARIASLMEKENIDNNKKLPIELTSDSCVKEMLEKLSRGGSLTAAEHERLTRLGDVSGRIQKAKGDLLKAHSKSELKPQKSPEPPKKSENDIHWENLVNQLNRPLELCDLDFTDLNEEDDKDMYSITHGGVPPPPPPPPPPPLMAPGIPPPPPPLENGHANTDDEANSGSLSQPNGPIPPPPPIGTNKRNKSKKTIKLFWKEIREDRMKKTPTVWDTVQPVTVDVQKLEHLFESRAKDIISKKQQEQKGIKEVIVLDSKRSNVINIGMTKLPPPRTIKTAILKMDSSIINREGIEKLLQTMLPTAEEKKMIQEAAISNPELPLGSAEQFLMMLASISELPARLKLWLFKLDFEVMEREVAEPLMDLKQGITDIQKNKTFEIILSILLSVGNFLNSSESKGFQIDYLAKVPEVKDTVHKHSLLHHLCHIVIEKFPDTSDLYSEIGSITRASKVDFDELLNTIEKMETECKGSWDHLKAIAKHDGPTQMKLKMSEFLADAAERIIVLGIIYRRVIHRFQRFLMWLGMPPNVVLESKPQSICSVISEFALEYRTCRERVIQQIQKKATHRERNKTRGKMITEEKPKLTPSRSKSILKTDRMEKFKSRPKTKEEEADSDLRQLLNYSDVSDTDTIRGKNTWRRTREGKARSRGDEAMEMLLLNAEGVDDALLDSLVKTATQTSHTRSNPRERKRSRHADRKSLRRTLKNGLSEEEKRILSII